MLSNLTQPYRLNRQKPVCLPSVLSLPSVDLIGPALQPVQKHLLALRQEANAQLVSIGNDTALRKTSGQLR